jgi:hypothetical protein
MVRNLLDFIDEKVDEQNFDRIVEAQQTQLEEFKPNSGKLDVFRDILPSLLQTKKHILENEKDYVPFLVNRMMSYHDDALYYANEMNLHHQLSKRMQYDFYFHGLRSKKRGWAKWIKPVKEADLAAVKLYFGYSDAKARTSLNILTTEQLAHIREITTVGE